MLTLCALLVVRTFDIWYSYLKYLMHSQGHHLAYS
jgi:hypothetical protein